MEMKNKGEPVKQCFRKWFLSRQLLDTYVCLEGKYLLVSESLLPLFETSYTHEPLPRFFRCILSSLACLGKTCFQQAGSSTVEGTSQAALGSSDQRKVPASLSLFLKREKIPAVFYVGKGPEYRPFLDLRSVLEAGIRPFSYPKKQRGQS
jgi:hypothetical protein